MHRSNRGQNYDLAQINLTSTETMEKITFETSVGNFEIELYSQHAPKTCTNFFQLASIGYYNDTVFHRIIKDFVRIIQQ